MFVSFMGMLTMQVGVIVFATSFITNAVCTLITNLLFFRSETMLPGFIVVTFCLFLITTWSVAFNGAFSESLKVIKAAHVMWSIFLCAWILTILCSWFTFSINTVCVDTRCPETMWLVQNPRPYITNSDEATMHNMTTRKLNPTTELISKNYSHTTSKVHKTNRKHRLLYRLKTSKEDQHHIGNHQIVTMTISVIVMIIYFGIFIYAWLFLHNYKTHIRLKNDNTENGTSSQRTIENNSNVPNII